MAAGDTWTSTKAPGSSSLAGAGFEILLRRILRNVLARCSTINSSSNESTIVPVIDTSLGAVLLGMAAGGRSTPPRTSGTIDVVEATSRNEMTELMVAFFMVSPRCSSWRTLDKR